MSINFEDDDWSIVEAETDDIPSAYDGVEASHRLFGRIQSTLNSERDADGEDKDPIETENMRKFLLYCLATDYRFSVELELSATEREKYLEIGNLLSDLRRSHNKTNLTQFERRVLAPYLWKYLHAPCKWLSIPVECAVTVIEHFAKYTNTFNQYKGCAYGVLHNSGPKMLAHKLWQDRNILLPRLVTGETRQAFAACITDVVQQYFISIDGVDSNIYADEGSWAEGLRISYNLTARGEAYASERERSLKAATRDYARVFMKAVVACMFGIQRRRGVFPQGKLASDYEAAWTGPGLALTGALPTINCAALSLDGNGTRAAIFQSCSSTVRAKTDASRNEKAPSSGESFVDRVNDLGKSLWGSLGGRRLILFSFQTKVGMCMEGIRSRM
jgi:hypothetical protein